MGPNTKDAILGNSRKEQLCFCILDFPVEQMVSGWVVRGFDGLWEDNLSLFYPQCFPYNLVSLRLYVGLHTKVNELNLKYPWYETPKNTMEEPRNNIGKVFVTGHKSRFIKEVGRRRDIFENPGFRRKVKMTEQQKIRFDRSSR